MCIERLGEMTVRPGSRKQPVASRHALLNYSLRGIADRRPSELSTDSRSFSIVGTGLVLIWVIPPAVWTDRFSTLTRRGRTDV